MLSPLNWNAIVHFCHISRCTQRTLFLLSLLVVAGLSHAAPAPIITSTQEQAQTADHQFGIGLTSSIAQRPFIGVDDQDTSLIYLSYRYKRFYIEGLDIGLNVWQQDKLKLDVLATPRFYEVEPAFAANGELDGLDKTGQSYFAGISAQYQTDTLVYTLQILHDLVESDGNEIVLQAGHAIEITGDFRLIPSVGVTYQDAQLVDYFYGVQAHEVRAGRPQYTGQASLNYNVTLNASAKITSSIELLGQLRYERLGDGITDSPIVDEDAILSVTLGAVYRF